MRFNTALMRKTMNLAVSRLKFGTYCAICERAATTGLDLCAECESLFVRLRHTNLHGQVTQLCRLCGVPYCVSRQTSCDQCRDVSSLFNRIIAPYRYEFPLDRVIQRMKYHDQRQIARVLGTLLARHVALSVDSRDFPDSLIAVPLHERRERQRGFNQAHDIAHWCARELNVPLGKGYAARIAETDSLAGLSRAERQYRILGAFRASAKVANKRLAIVDDVLTTGSTARELARELYDTGALSVELWVLARTSSERLPG